MGRSTGLWLVVAVAVGAGAVGWLVLGGQGGGGGEDVLGTEHAAVAGSQGPMLTGREGGKSTAGAAAVVDEGTFEIPGKLLDAKGKPVADVTVALRRKGDAWPMNDPRRWRWDPADAIEKAFSAEPSTAEEGTPAGSARSGADGTFHLVVHRRGDYLVRAEPEAPRVGTYGSWYLNDSPPTSPLTLRVLDGSALKGRVVDAHDHGVSAVVRATWSGEGNAWSGAPQPTASGSGAFAFPAVPNGKVLLDVALPGRLRLSGRSVTAPTAAEVLIRVDEGAPLLSGRVKDLQGQPVPGARVSVSVNGVPVAGENDPLTLRYLAQADADGRYTVAGPLGGPVAQVEAAAPGYLYASASPPLAPWSGLELVAGKEAALDLTLMKGGVVEGRVTEKGSGQPLAGAEIRAIPSALDAHLTRPPSPTATSDAQGRYRLEGVPLGRSLLLVKHPTHFLPALEALPHPKGGNDYIVSWDSVATGPPPALTVFVQTEGERVVRDLALARGIPVSGHVLDAAGKPVEGAQVFARGLGLGNQTWRWGLQEQVNVSALATSGPEGKFGIGGLPPRPDWVLYAKKSPLIGEPSPPFALSAESRTPEVALKVVPGAVLAGHVVDERGVGVEGASVNAWSNDQELGGGYQTVTAGPDGSFRVEGLSGGQVGLNASATGYGSAYQQIDGLTAGETRDGVEVKLKAGVEISGTLVDESGAPVRGKMLLAMSQQGGNQTQAYSQADGTFHFTGLVSGATQISGGSWENNVALGSFTAPSRDVRITWKEPPQQVIEGTVLDSKGKPVPLCTVTISPAGRDGMAPTMVWGGDNGGTVVNGWFRRNAQGKPPFTVAVSAPQDAQGRPLNLKGKNATVADPKAGPITITLEPGREVAGRVLDPAGKGVEGVTVVAGTITTQTDDAGAFTVAGLADGASLNLDVRPPAPWAKPPATSVAADATEVVVRLKPGAVIAGTVRGEEGRPVSAGGVNVSWPASPSGPQGNTWTQLDQHGHFRAEGLPEDAVATVQVQTWGGMGAKSYSPRTVTNVRAGTEDLVIDMASGVEVDGTVLDAEGKPTQGWVMVAILGEGGKTVNQSYSQIQPDGTFKIAGLPRGPVNLTVHRQDGGPSPDAVRVEAPASGVRLVLPAATPIKGTLLGAGNQASTFRVWAWTVGDNRRSVRPVAVQSDGRFSLDAVGGSGQWMVGARGGKDDDRYALAGPFAAGTEDVRLELRTGRAIEGSVTQADGTTAPAGTWVQLHGNGWDGSAQTVDAQGQFHLRAMPPGRYTLTAYTNDGHSVSKEDVEDGSRDVRLVLK